MSTPNTTRWVGIGLLGLPFYGVLTFFSSLNPQPDPNTQFEAWSHYVSTDFYALKHLFASILGLILGIFGTFALGAYLTRSRAPRLGLVAMVITVLGSALFLPAMGVSTFTLPKEGQAYLAGIEEYDKLPLNFADYLYLWTSLLTIVLLFVGNVLLGIAVWRCGILSKWAGALWAAGAVLMYPLGIVYAIAILGVQSTPKTVLLGALLLVVGGAWMAFSVLSRPSAAQEAMGAAAAQPRVR